MNDKIKLQKSESDEFRAQLGSESFSLQGEIFKDFGDKQLNIYFALVEFTYRIVTVIGLIAGFGFTGLSSIADGSRVFFVTGEALLFLGIITGIYLVHYVYAEELSGIQTEQRKLRKHFKERNLLYKKLSEGLNGDGVNPGDIKALLNKDNEGIAIFEVTEMEDDPEDLDKFKSYQRILIHLLIGGCVALLLGILIK